MKILKFTYILFGVLLCGNFYAQQTPAPTQAEAISIIGATAHIGNGEIIENSLLVFEDGKIVFVGQNNTNAVQGRIIDAKGKHVYPGFIAPNTTLGLVEVDAVRATKDDDEIGDLLPHIRSLIAYNTESKIVESMRPNGVLIGQVVPRGGRISGTSSIVQFDAWNWEDAVIKEDDGIHINWPVSFSNSRSGIKENKNYQQQITALEEFFASSKAYLAGKKTFKNLAFQSMEEVFKGNARLYIHADGEKELRDILQFKQDENIMNLVIVGGYESHKIMDELKANNIAVLVKRVHSSPLFDDEDYDFPFRLAGILYKNGILVALESSGQMERMNTRNLPFYAGTTAAYGLNKEEALKLISLNTAKILGIDEKYGSLETGKSATLFISEGDALDMRTNILSHAFIDGREISLESHQTELYKRYDKKYKDMKNPEKSIDLP